MPFAHVARRPAMKVDQRPRKPAPKKSTPARATGISRANSRRDGEETRERILDAAEELFAAHGFHGTSLRDVAEAIGSGIALVTYHFGTKDVLFSTVVKRRAVLGTGTILNRSTPVYDLVRGTIYRATDSEPLVIPEEAVIVAGSRAITNGPGKDWGISVYTPVIVKYRDSKTDTKIQLEDLLR